MFRSLRVRNYRLYASGQLISLTGTWMQRVAQDWLVLELTNSGTALGVVTALQFGPALLFGLWGGVIADRGDKRKILFATQGALALVALLLGVLDVAGVVQYWHVLVLAMLLGFVSAVDTPVRQSFVVEMVGRKDLANALSSAAVLCGLWMMRPAELYPAPLVRRARGQLREGIRYVRRRADLMLTMVLVFVIGTFGLNFQITTALMAKQVFHRGASGYGLLSTSLAVGACAGAVLATRRSARPTQLFLVATAIAFSMFEIASGVMPGYDLTALLLVPTGLAMLTLTTAANSSVQLGVEPTMRGRVMALYLVCFMGGTPFGAPIVGWLAGVAGPRWGLVGGGLICLVTTLAIAAIIGQRRGLTPSYLAQRASRVAHA
jgi:MFS family permease